VRGARQPVLPPARSQQIRACYLAPPPSALMVQQTAGGARRFMGAEARAVQDHAPVHVLKAPERMEDFEGWLSHLRESLEEQIGPEAVRDRRARGKTTQTRTVLQDADLYDREAWAHSMARVQDQLLRRALDAEADQEHGSSGGALAPARGPRDEE